MKFNINEDISEFIGVIIGDGHLHFSKPKDKRKVYYVNIAGNLSEDLDYHQNYLKPLFYRLFNTDITIIKQRKNEISTKKHSKEIVSYIKDTFKIPVGNKSNNCNIPPFILTSKSNKIKSSFLRGLADTDFSLMFKKKNGKEHDYPTIKIGFKSKRLVEDLKSLLKEFKFKFGKIIKDRYYDKRYNKKYKKYCIYLYGKDNLERWMRLIGFNNERHLTKYNLWKKYGFCQINTSLRQRKAMLRE